MKNTKKWKAFKRQKSPLLTESQMKKRLAFARKYKHLTAQEWENFVFSDESSKQLFHISNPKNDIVWGSQSEEVPDVTCAKNSAKVMIWGAMGAYGLSNLHLVPQGCTITAQYYQEKVLEKELKPALKRIAVCGKTDKRKLIPDPRKVIFQQDGATPHTHRNGALTI